MVEKWVPETIRSKEIGIKREISIPYLMPEPTKLLLTISELISVVLSIPLVLMYAIKKHWLANNVIAIAFSIQVARYWARETIAAPHVRFSRPDRS